MPYLDTYSQALTVKTAAHLLRRATLGPTQTEITQFTGLTAEQAVQQLIANANYSPAPPVDLDCRKATAGQTYLDKPFNSNRKFDFGHYLRHWWLGLMTSQTAPPSLLDKLTLFWQNHFVTTRTIVEDYRYINQYLLLLRNNALGNFRTLVTQISKEPAMLRYLHGYKNKATKTNEKYARALLELFTVGAFDSTGNENYTEDDVKAAAKVLTGWTYTNYLASGSTSFDTEFTAAEHDSTDKPFSACYGNTLITGRSSATAGDEELSDLVTMLLKHPQSPRFICQKLYRFYVNPHITQAIETNVIVPLAQFFASTENKYAIQPVIVKLLTSQIFFDEANRGAIIKSPAELAIGAMRFFNQPVPDMTTDYGAFKTYMDFIVLPMRDMQMPLLDQPSVFGYAPYYQAGYSRIWINDATLTLRNRYLDAYIWRRLQVKPSYTIGIDMLAWATSLQPNFSDVSGTPAISCLDVQSALAKNLFATDLFQAQIDFLIDTIMMQGNLRSSWTFEWNAHRSAPGDTDKKNEVLFRLQNLMRYMLYMAEYQLT